MSDSGVIETNSAHGVDAYGKDVDLSEFEESYYRSAEVQKTLEQYRESLEGSAGVWKPQRYGQKRRADEDD